MVSLAPKVDKINIVYISVHSTGPMLWPAMLGVHQKSDERGDPRLSVLIT